MSFFQIIKKATVAAAGATVSTLTMEVERDMQPMIFANNESLIYQLPTP